MAESIYDVNSLPDNFDEATKPQSFTPLPEGMYQVQVLSVVIKDNPFYKVPEEGELPNGNPYQVSAQLAVLDNEELYGRRLFDNFTPILKNTGKKGPTKLYKFVSACLKSTISQEECDVFSTKGEFYPNLKTLEGKQVSIAIETTPNQMGKLKNKVVAYYVTKSDLPKLDLEKSKKLGETIKGKKK